MSTLSSWHYLQEERDDLDHYRLVGLMVSGGSDSMAMLHMAAQGELAGIPHDAKLVVIHVNHHLRDAHLPWMLDPLVSRHDELTNKGSAVCVDAPNNLDAQLVKETAEQLGLPCYILDVDVASAYRMRPAASLEEVARRLRYAAAFEQLDTLCEQFHVDQQDACLFTAHTATDRAETLMMRLMTGTSPAGLSACLDGRARVIRPLQHSTREELQEYLNQRGLSWREDETNADTAYLRAFVRHELFPLMQQRNPSVVEALVRTADLLQTEHEFLQQRALDKSDGIVTHKTDCELVFDSYELARYPLALIRRIVLKALQDLAGDAARITSEAVDTVIRAGCLHFQDGAKQPSATLAGALDMRCDRDGVVVTLPASSASHSHTGGRELDAQQCVVLEVIDIPPLEDCQEPIDISSPGWDLLVNVITAKPYAPGSAEEWTDFLEKAAHEELEEALSSKGEDAWYSHIKQYCEDYSGGSSVVDASAVGLGDLSDGTRFLLTPGQTLQTSTGTLSLGSVWEKPTFTYEHGSKRIYDVAAQEGIPTRLMSQVPAVLFEKHASELKTPTVGGVHTATHATHAPQQTAEGCSCANKPIETAGCAVPVCLPGIRVALPFQYTKDSHKVVKLSVRAPYDQALQRTRLLKMKREAFGA